MSFFVYAIQSQSGRIYLGQTADVSKRLSLHNAGNVYSTRSARPWFLIKTEEFWTREKARYFEWCLKKSKGKRLSWLRK